MFRKVDDPVLLAALNPKAPTWGGTILGVRVYFGVSVLGSYHMGLRQIGSGAFPFGPERSF